MKLPTTTLAIFLLFMPLLAFAQSPVNGFMQPKGHGSVVLSHNFESYNSVFLVPKKVEGVPIFNEIKVNSTSVYTTYGLSDKLNVVLNVPYIKAEGAASEQVLKNLNYTNTQSGLQDVSVYVKYEALTVESDKRTFSLIGAFGVKTPLGDYTIDNGLQNIIAIGNRATSVNALVIGLLRDNSGFFVSGQAGYCLRNNQVPDAVMSEFKIGLIKPRFYVDALVANQTSLGGTDILADGFQGFFPSTKVHYTRLGLNIFIPIYGRFGLCTGASTYIAGRNLGQSTSIYGGVSASF